MTIRTYVSLDDDDTDYDEEPGVNCAYTDKDADKREKGTSGEYCSRRRLEREEEVNY